MRKLFKLLFGRLIIKLKNPRITIGHNVSISMDCTFGEKINILEGSKLGSCKVSSYTYIGRECDFAYTQIGSFCSIGPQVICGLGKHPLDFVSTYPGFYSDKASGSSYFGVSHDVAEHNQTIINSDVWIGARVLILGGIKIGTGAVVAAGSVVTKDIPPYAIVGGTPAKILRYRFDDDLIQSLLNSKWWELDEAELTRLAVFMNKPREFLSHLIITQ